MFSCGKPISHIISVPFRADEQRRVKPCHSFGSICSECNMGVEPKIGGKNPKLVVKILMEKPH